MRLIIVRNLGRVKKLKLGLLLLTVFCITVSNVHASNRDSLALYFKNIIALLESGRQDSAKIWYDRAIHLAPQSADTVTAATVLMDIGKAYEDRGLHIFSFKAYHMAVSLLQTTGEDQLIGRCFLDLSGIAFRMGNNERSLKYCMEATSIYKRLGDTRNYITASMLIGQVYIDTRKYKEAREIYDQMLVLSKQIADSVLIADNLDHIGVIYSFQEDYDNTLRYFKEAQKINSRLNNVRSLAINYSNIGEIFMRQGNYEEGLVFLKKGLSMARESDFKSLNVFIYYTLGDLYSRMNNPSQAERNFQQSLTLISEIGEYRELPIVYKLMAEHFERSKKFADALTYFKLYNQKQDSLKSDAVAYQMAELTVIYEIEKVDESLRNEKLLLLKEQEANKKTIRLQKLGIIVTVIGLLIALTLGIFLLKIQKSLRTANKTREVLISIIGHDLRGPMANINKLLEMLKADMFMEKHDIISLLEKPVKASYELLQDLLMWSVFVNEKETYNPEKVNLLEVVNKCFTLVGDIAEEKKIGLICTIEPDIIVYADRNHIYTALRNLISNGIKFTPTMGTITVGCSRLAERIRIEVTDTGVGIDAATIKNIMGSKSAFSTRGTKNEKGSGLGLLLTKECIRLNGGVLAIASTPGQGSTFSFTLPYSTDNMS